MSKSVYIVSAMNEDGILVTEVFEDSKYALAFERDDIKEQVCREYGNAAVHADHFTISFSKRKVR